jgi:hypothetical protein
MRKFTVFTVILTVLIVVVVAELFVDEYLPNLTKTDVSSEELNLNLPDSLDVSGLGQTNVLGSDVDYNSIQSEDLNDSDEYLDFQYEEIPFNSGSELLLDTPIETTIDDNLLMQDTPTYAAPSSDIPDFEDGDTSSLKGNVYLREDMIRSAGFSGASLEEEAHNGFLYKTIFIDDLYDVEVVKYSVKTADTILAKVYIFKIGASADVHQVYEVLKIRASEGLDITVNETNEFGVNSFFMNDSGRSNAAFLTVRMGSLIYGFSYPKEYHAQIKNLIILLDLEF